MKKSISVNKKPRGRPKKVGGIHPVSAVRLPPEISVAVDVWAAKQDDQPGRSEAIRRLVELGLTVKPKARPRTDDRQQERAREMAATTIDRKLDPAAPEGERAQRKRRLIKGPEEFRDKRVDRPKAKKI